MVIKHGESMCDRLCQQKTLFDEVISSHLVYNSILAAVHHVGKYTSIGFNSVSYLAAVK